MEAEQGPKMICENTYIKSANTNTFDQNEFRAAAPASGREADMRHSTLAGGDAVSTAAGRAGMWFATSQAYSAVSLCAPLLSSLSLSRSTPA
jgi:hypothetical protein